MSKRPTAATARISSHTDMATALMRMQQAGDAWHPPLLRAAMNGEISFAIVGAGSRVPNDLLAPQSRPMILVLGGDDIEPAGPGAFPSLWRPMKWARAIMLHGTGGQPEHYALAVHQAQISWRVLIIEAASEHLAAWAAACRRHAQATPVLELKPPPGASHPCETAPAGTVVQ